MNPRTLAYVVLAYAAFSAASVLPLVGLILGNPSRGWLVLADAAPWLAFVLGGFGLLFARPWSRGVLLLAAGGTVVTGALSLVLVSGSDLPMRAVSVALGLLLPVAIFVGTLKLPAPASWQVPPVLPTAKRAVLPLIDLAYACFAWIAAVVCGVQLVSLVPMDFTTAQGLGMIVGIPLALASLAAGAVAAVLSIIQWREWPLLLMSAASVSMVLVFLAEDAGNVNENVALGWFVVATAMLVFLCVRWFGWARRRARARS